MEKTCWQKIGHAVTEFRKGGFANVLLDINFASLPYITGRYYYSTINFRRA